MFLEIKGIKKSFGTGDSRVNVLKGFDLEIERGEFCVLLGPSGSGKSTLLNIIGGIDDHPLNQAQPDVLQKPLEVGAFNVLAGVTLVFVFLTLTAFKLIAAKFKLTFNADAVLFVNRLPPINCIYSTIHN